MKENVTRIHQNEFELSRQSSGGFNHQIRGQPGSKKSWVLFSKRYCLQEMVFHCLAALPWSESMGVSAGEGGLDLVLSSRPLWWQQWLSSKWVFFSPSASAAPVTFISELKQPFHSSSLREHKGNRRWVSADKSRSSDLNSWIWAGSNLAN